jgi:putative membrane-bound dehydrogenase-like protein
VLSVVASSTPSLSAADIASPLAPRESLAHFQVDAGLAVELVACEPEVIDPIAIRFDEDGRLWVVEMRDYPNGPKPGEQPGSKIRILSDGDGDGRYETSQVFAEHLLFPTGLQPWRGGVIVTLAGQVVYMKDSDGDGRADRQEVWFRGFAAENPQLRANHPRFSLDNRVYIANGLRGGAIVDPRRGEQEPLSISGMDFRFDPANGRCEAVSGNGQFGLTFDDFGNRFVCNNRAPLEHVVLENQYLARNPFLAVPSAVASVAPGGEQSRVFPLVSAWTTSNLHAGQFTAACGVEIYRDAALGDEYRGNAFVCEPTGSLVHREVPSAKGVSFVSKPAQEGKEFLATRDSWFRPVNLEVGPDGALYVVDMYRAVIEHPQFMPSELQSRADMRLGDDRGRIYRVVRAGAKPSRTRPKLSSVSIAQLVELLRHPNAWWRDNATRLLYERQDMAAAAPLARLAAAAPEPSARAAALWALEGLGALSPESIDARLADEHPRVREQAVALAEPRLIASAQLREKILALTSDADDRVRFRAALAMGGLKSQDVVESLLAVALARPDDAWTRRAVSTALPETVASVLSAAIESHRVQACQNDAPQLTLVRELATIVGSHRDAKEIATALAAIVQPAEPTPACEIALLGLAQGLERRGAVLAEFVAQTPGDSTSVETKLTSVFHRATAAVLDETRTEDVRAHKIDLLKYARTPSAGTALARIVSQDASQLLRIRAANALAPYGAQTARALLAGYSAQTPAVRRVILDALAAHRDSAALLLDGLESRAIARAELDATRENALRHHADASVAARAREILAAAVPAERKKVLAEYQASLELAGNPLAGKELFKKNCTQCHRIGTLGVNVAPDISDSRTKTPQQLLVDILNPNQAIDNNYLSYTILTTRGIVHTGVIAAETASSVTLRQPEDKSLDLLRADIERIQSNGVSLMPEGLEKELSQRQMADLISFIKNWRYLEQAIPGTIGAGAR